MDHYFIHHGPESQPKNGAKGGVAIILSPELARQWKSSGNSKKLNRGGTSIGGTTRFFSISMNFNLLKPDQKNPKHHNLCLTTIYFPHSGYKESELDKFNFQLSSFLSTVLPQKNTTHIIGADTNSSIGTRKSLEAADSLPNKHESNLEFDPALDLLGPFGNPKNSKSGEAVLNLMHEHELRATSTFYDNNRKYNTWLGLPNAVTKKRQAYQLDHMNVKHRFDGEPSDHAALSINFRFLTTPLRE